jgi:hypothetical protein
MTLYIVLLSSLATILFIIFKRKKDISMELPAGWVPRERK